MHSSGILRFDDTINDMDFFSKFKYTTKGPNSLGGKNSNNISIRYRGKMYATIFNRCKTSLWNTDIMDGVSGFEVEETTKVVRNYGWRLKIFLIAGSSYMDNQQRM